MALRRGSPFVCYWLPVIAWALVITIGTSLPRVPGPEVDGGDKLAHLLAYGVLGLLLMRGLRRSHRLPLLRAGALTLGLGGTYGVLDELHQIPLPGRSCTLGDIAADLLGLALAGVVFWTWQRLRQEPRGTESQIDGERNAMAEPLHLNGSNFESEILRSDVPALVDFWAPWCGPCHMMTPALEKLAGEYDGRAKIAKLNVDENMDLATKYGIRSIPALLFFHGGEVVDYVIGVQSEETLRQKLESLA